MIRLGFCNELFEGWEFARVCETVKALGYDGLEIAPFTLAPLITDVPARRLREVRSMIEDAGLETIGLHWLLARTEGFHLTSPDAEVRRKTARYLVSLAEATAALGGSLMVLGSPKQRSLLPGVSPGEAMDYAEGIFTSSMAAIGACGVTLCIEPLAPAETDFLTSIRQANELIDRVDHDHFVLHMDVKAQSADPDGSVTELIARYAPLAGHFHAQDPNGKGPGMGEVDFGPILKALVASGYDRWVSVEVFDAAEGIEETASRSIDCLIRGLEAASR